MPPPTFEEAYLNFLEGRAWQDSTRALQAGGRLPSPQTREPGAFAPLVEQVSLRYGVDPRLIDAVIQVESNYNPRAVSPAGAQGLMQLMPATARYYNVRDPFDPEENLEAGVHLLADLSRRYSGNQELILAAYNAGEKAVNKHQGIPPYRETQAYVPKVLSKIFPPRPPGVSTDPAEVPALVLPTPGDALRAWWHAPAPRPLRGGGPATLSAATSADVRSATMTPEQRAQQQRLQGGGPATLTAATPEEVRAGSGGGIPAPEMVREVGLGEVKFATPRGQVSGPATAPLPMTPSSIVQAPEALVMLPGDRMAPASEVSGAVQEAEPSRTVGNWGGAALGMARDTLTGLSAELGQATTPDDPLGGASIAATRQGLATAASLLDEAARDVLPHLAAGEQWSVWDKLMQGVGTSLLPLTVGALSGGAGWLASAGSAVTESLAEAGSVHRQLAPVVGDAEASQRAAKSFGANVILVGLTDRLGIFGEAATTLRRTLSAIVSNGVQGGVQYDLERRQLWVPADHPQAGNLQLQGWVKQGERVAKPFDATELGEAVLLEALVGGTTSAAFGLALERAAMQEQTPALAPVREMIEQEQQKTPEFHLTDALQAMQQPDTPPPDVPLPTWQRWGQAVVDILSSERGSLGGGTREPPTPETLFPPAGPVVDGRTVRADVPNTASIAATYNEGEYTVLPGIREVALDLLGPPPATPLRLDRRTQQLADEIAASQEINPLIVVVDATGPYVLEGGHRLDALDSLGAQSFPALVLVTPDAQPLAKRAQPAPGLGSIIRDVLGNERGGIDLFGNEVADEGGTPEQPTSSQAQPGERQPSPEQLGLGGMPQPTTFTLPPALARATPRMATVTLDFASDLDKALYILGNPQTQSANHDAYLQEVMDFLRVPERTALVQAQQRRDQIVAYARKHGQPDSPLRIPDMSAPAPTQPGLAQPGVMPTTQMEMPLLGAETGDMQGLPLLDKDTMANLRDFLRMIEAERAPTLEIEGKPLEINYAHIATDDGVKQILSAISEVYMDQVAKVRTPRSVEETREDARRQGMTIAQFLMTDRESLVSRKKALVAREMAVASARQLRVATALFHTQQLSGRELLRTFAVHSAIQVQFARLANEAGGALQIFSAPVEGDLTSLRGFESIMEQLGSQQVSPELLAQMIEATPTPEQLALLVEQAPEATLKGQLLQAWYGFWLLSNPKTFIVNFLSNFVSLMEGPLTRALAARMPDTQIPLLGSGARLSVADATRRAVLAEQADLDPAIREQEHADRSALYMRDVERGEASAMVYGAWRSLTDAWRIAQIAFETGEPQVTPQMTQEGLEGTRPAPLTAANLRSTGTMGQVLAAGPLGYAWNAIGVVANTVSRGLIASDEFFKVLNYRQELYALAWRQAVEQGLSGEKSLEEVAQDAEAFITNPPPGAKAIALGGANERTFTRPLEDLGALGRLGAGVQNMADYAPILRLFVPFVRTPVNITQYNFERFPLTAMLMKSVKADLSAGGARRDIALAKMTLGAGTFGLIATFAAMGYLTGEGPEKRAEQELERTTEGRQEYSIWVPGLNRWIQYSRLDPLGQYLGFVADWVYHAGEAYASNSFQERLEQGAAGAAAFAQNITNRNYMQGLANLMKLWTESAPNNEVELGKFTRFVNQMATSLIPAGVGGITRAMDPRLMEIRDVFDAWRARLPWTEKNPRLNFWADAVEVGHLWPGVDLINPFLVQASKQDALSRWLLDIHATVTPPSRYLIGKRSPQQGFEDEPVELTPAAWNRMKTLFAKEPNAEGQTLRQALDAIRLNADNAKAPREAHGQLARLANGVITRFKDQALMRFVQENSAPGTPYYALVSRFRLAEGGRKVRQSPENADEIMNTVFDQLGVR